DAKQIEDARKRISEKKSPPPAPVKKIPPPKKEVEGEDAAFDELEAAAQELEESQRKRREKTISRIAHPPPSVEEPPSPLPKQKKYSAPPGASSLAKRLGISKTQARMPLPVKKAPEIKKPEIKKKEIKEKEIVEKRRVEKAGEIEKVEWKIEGEEEVKKEKPAVKSSLSEEAKKMLTPEKGQQSTAVADELFFAYAKEKYKWLYEIYKMGGMSLEEFRRRVKEKMSQGSGEGTITPEGGGDGEDTDNPAFNNLNKELDKKFKK
ncbi:MAG: hypothetical protein ABIH83_04080, partial [Candidatus Micrarchaeota archaeon]